MDEIRNSQRDNLILQDHVWKSIVYDLVSASAMVFNGDSFGDTEVNLNYLTDGITCRLNEVKTMTNFFKRSVFVHQIKSCSYLLDNN